MGKMIIFKQNMNCYHIQKWFFLSLFFGIIFLNPFSCHAQRHTGKSGLEVYRTYSQNILGKNIGYYIEFKNTSDRSVDAIEWEAYFYNNFKDLKGKRKGSWSSGNIIKPIPPNNMAKDLQASWVDGAEKVYIKVTRVHFED